MGRGGAGIEPSILRPAKSLSVVVVAGAAFVGLRLLVLASGWRTYAFTDSGELRPAPGHDTLPFVSFTGQAQRPPIVPAFYAVLGTDEARVVGQFVVSVGAWLLLAGVVAALIRHRRVRIAAVSVVLCAGTSRSVTNWDLAILAESLAISALCLCLAAWLWFASCPSVGSAATVVGSTAVMTLIRIEVVVVLPVLAGSLGIVGLVVAWRHRSFRRSWSWAMVALGLVAVTGWGLVIARGNEEVSAGRTRGMGRAAENVSQVARVRVVHDPAVFDSLTAMGMPRPENLIAVRANGVTGDAEFEAMRSDKAFVAWASASGPSTLLRHSLAHPNLFPRQFGAELPGLLVPPAPNGATYTEVAVVLPGPIEAMFSPTSDTWPLPSPPVFLAVPVLVAALVRRRRRPLLGAPFVVALAAVPLLVGLLFIGWLVSAMELVRHTVPFALLIPVMAMVAALLLLDATIDAPIDATIGRPHERWPRAQRGPRHADRNPRSTHYQNPPFRSNVTEASS